MTGKERRITLIFIGVVILMTVLIAAGLPRLVFQPGLPLPSIEHGKFVADPAEKGSEGISISINAFFVVLFELLLAATFLYVIYRLLKGMAWKKYRTLILKAAGALAGIGLIFSLIIAILSSMATKTLGEAPMPLPVEPPARTPLGEAPSFLYWVIGFVLLLIAAGVGVWVYETFTKKNKPLDLLMLEAEKARQALLTGENIHNVIIRCYLQMSLVVKLEQGVERKEFMTPREFEQQLEALGLPFGPIHQLTQLFETARYGDGVPAAGDEQKALDCLNAIVQSSLALKQDSEK